MEAADELGDGRDAGAQVRDGQHLCFIEDDDALGQVVELPALGGPIAVDGLEELHRCGHHHRHIPILRGSGHPLGLRGSLVLGVVGDAGVVFQHVLRPQDLAELVRRLLDDGGVRDDVDDPLQAVGLGVVEGEGQRGHRLPAASGNGEGV